MASKELTVKGKLFRDIAKMIITAHNFGSNKMINRYDLYDYSELDFNSREVVDAYYFLVENEWVREYTPVRLRKSRKAYNYGTYEYVPTSKGTYLGLTQKGWAVATKYVD